MTADWLATLERVAELLAEAKDGFAGGEVSRASLAAMSDLTSAILLVSSLAEPQPEPVDPEGLDICKHGMVGRCRDCLKAEIKLLREICRTNGWPDLAEPQVNPSEAKTRWYACDNCGRVGPVADFQDECKPGWTHGRLLPLDMDSPALRRAGLLAEGEENREPERCPTCCEIGPDTVDRVGDYGGDTFEARCGDDWHDDKVTGGGS